MAKTETKVKGVMMVALKPGFYGGKRLREGAVFEFTGIPGKWMAPVSKPVKAKKAEKEAPTTFSEMQAAEKADEKQYN